MHSALNRATAARAGGRDAPSFLQLCTCVSTLLSMLLMRVPVHGVGESYRPSQVYSDMKYIFCEYLRPFAAREEHAVGLARARRPRRFMVTK